MAFPYFQTLSKLYNLILLGMPSLKINIYSCSIFGCCCCRYGVTIRFITWKYRHFWKYGLIFWMSINCNRRPPLRNVFCWEFVTILLKPIWKSFSSLLSISSPRYGRVFISLNSSDWLGDVKLIVFEYVFLGLNLAFSINKYLFLEENWQTLCFSAG